MPDKGEIFVNGKNLKKIDKKSFREKIGIVNQDLTLFYEDKELWSQSMIWTSKCGKPMIKFGIYRPGNEKEILETSIVDYDYIKIKEIKN